MNCKVKTLKNLVCIQFIFQNIMEQYEHFENLRIKYKSFFLLPLLAPQPILIQLRTH